MGILAWIGLLLVGAAWFIAAADAFNQKPTYGYVLLFAPLLYPTYAIAFIRRPAAAVSLLLTVAAVALGLV